VQWIRGCKFIGACMEKIFSDGLVNIDNDGDIVSMIAAVKEHKLVSIYVDHTNL
jgi:hypothetical protein